MQAYHGAPTTSKLPRVYPAYADEIENTKAGYKPTWGLHVRTPRQLVTDAASWKAALVRAGYQTHYRDPASDTKLGRVDIADKKRKEDEEAGGLVYQACHRTP
jgi:hypothetical protein